MIANLFTQADTFVQLLDGEDSDEKAVTAMGILNTLETMLNVMERSKEVHVSCNNDYCN